MLPPIPPNNLLASDAADMSWALAPEIKPDALLLITLPNAPAPGMLPVILFPASTTRDKALCPPGIP